MNPRVEIIMPVRNPSDIMLESIDSLIAQTRRSFAVLISDNHSSQGLEVIKKACHKLKSAKIPVRVVRPDQALGRVEHWNWAHSKAKADWLKPLFVGDILFPTYVKEILKRVAEKPKAKFIRCEQENRQADASVVTSRAPISKMSLTPADFLHYYPRLGNWLGGPVNVAYHRLAWQLSGGYMPQLPVCADLQLYVTMILRHGLESIPIPLVAFQLHPQRFSHKIGKRRVNGFAEQWLILSQLQNQCHSENLKLPPNIVLRTLWRLNFNHYRSRLSFFVKKLLGLENFRKQATKQSSG